MLYFDRINVSEGFDVNKTSASKECDIWYSLNFTCKFQTNVCIRYYDLLMMSMNLCDIAILNIKGCDYHCIITGISKSEAIKYEFLEHFCGTQCKIF